MVFVTQMVLIAIALILWSVLYLRRPRNLPPGPRGWPIIGSLHKICGNSEIHQFLHLLHQQYGDICSFYLGPHVAVVLSGSDVIKEAFVHKAKYFSARPDWLFLTKRKLVTKGILWSRSWHEMRRFTQIALKDFGIGTATISDRVRSEAEHLCAEFAQENEKVFDPQWKTRNAFSNVICSIVFGKRFDYNDPEFMELMERMYEYVKLNVMFSYPNFLPWTFILMLFGRTRKALQNLKALENFILDKIKDHKEDYDPDNIRDFIDLYIKHETQNGKEADLITEQGILTIIMELFFAGTESTSTTFLWFLLFMIRNPDTQKKCRQEIYEVIGSSRMACKKDMGQLPYVEATLMESMRMGSTAPFTLPHMVSETIEFKGYTLPKGAMVLADLYSTMQDSTLYSNPEEFRSERWLNGNGSVHKQQAFMPFGTGKRVCIGEELARKELFLVAVTVLQRFQLEMADPQHPPTTKPHSGITLLTTPFQLRAIPLQ